MRVIAKPEWRRLCQTISSSFKQLPLGTQQRSASTMIKYAPRVLGFLVKLLPNRTDADDVLQEVFWQVWKTAQRYDSTRATPQVWLFLMARSRAIDLMRKRKTEIPSSRSDWKSKPTIASRKSDIGAHQVPSTCLVER